jgi:hypothetical protein
VRHFVSSAFVGQEIEAKASGSLGRCQDEAFAGRVAA